MRVAYLGPAGTHSEIAFREFLPNVEGIPCFSITEIFKALLESRVDRGLVPIENMIQGPVTETLDLLFEHHGKVCIEDSRLLQIRNALGVLPSSPWPKPIRAVVSHEQPLRQCAKYLAEHFPQAEQIAVASTAAGIQLVQEQKRTDAAVIASPVSLEQAKWSVIENDISDVHANKTRFVLIRRGEVEAEQQGKKSPLSETSDLRAGHVTSIVVDPGRDRKGLLFEILQVISIRHRINLVTIHSRPDTKGGVIFYFDLEGHPGDDNIRDCLNDLRQFCTDTTGRSTEIHVLGAYPRTPFYTLPFRRIGIIGSAGVMGQWFARFFKSVDLEVLECDQKDGLPLSELTAKADVLLLSVPMSVAEEIVISLLPQLRPGQLIVENCSIKSCVLPALLAQAPVSIEVLGIHTMFGGDVPSLFDQNIIITNTARSGEKAQAFEDLLYKHGARVHHSSIEEHDHVAAFVQSVLQLNMIILADVMQRAFPSLKDLSFISTPNFRNVLQVMSRVLNQTDDLILDLQLENKQAETLRHRYLESAFRLIAALDYKDRRELERSIQSSRIFLNSRED